MCCFPCSRDKSQLIHAATHLIVIQCITWSTCYPHLVPGVLRKLKWNEAQFFTFYYFDTSTIGLWHTHRAKKIKMAVVDGRIMLIKSFGLSQCNKTSHLSPIKPTYMHLQNILLTVNCLIVIYMSHVWASMDNII